MKLIKFYKVNEDNQELNGIISRYNCYFRLLDIDGKEYFFRDQNNALKYCLDKGYRIENLFN